MAKRIPWISRIFKAKFVSKRVIRDLEEETQDQPWLCRGPCLMVCHGKGRKENPNPLLTSYDVTRQIHRTRISREFVNKYMSTSHGDWMVVRDNTDASDLCLLNAVTMEKLQLPMLPSPYGCKLLLSGSPTDAANCTVFLIVSDTIFHCKIGANQFNMQELNLDGLLDDAITIFQGMIYYIDNGYHLNCAQLQDSSPMQFEECILGYKLVDQLTFSGIGYLVGSHDQLLFIHVRYTFEMGVLDFEIFGADLSEKEWKKVNNIGGDRAIFIDEFKGFSTLVSPGSWLKGNCIYYVSEDDSDDEDISNTTFFRYDLEDGFVTTLPPFPFKMPRGKEHVTMHWMDCQVDHIFQS